MSRVMKALLMDQITITQNHVKLLGRSFYEYSTHFYEGCVSQDPKRPYGNGDVIGDLYEIIYGETWDEDESGYMSGTLTDELMDIHVEMGVVVQILVLSTANDFPFEVGRKYVKKERYNSLSWRPAVEDTVSPQPRRERLVPIWGPADE